MSKKEKKISKKESPKQNHYFPKEQPLEFFSSGCTLWDLSLGGGYVLGRVSNSCGKFSSGKTGTAVEATISFDNEYPEGYICYADIESALDKIYGRKYGMPLNKIQFLKDNKDFVNTVEYLYDKLFEFVEKIKKENVPGLFIIDSLDALSSEAELGRDIRKGTFGQEKAKKMSEIYRRLVSLIENSKLHLFIISQLRDKIGATMGEKETKGGGRSVDYYNTHVTKLKYLGKIKVTKNGFEKTIGINLRAVNKKNKISSPFLDVDFPLYETYGIHNTEASLQWLSKMEWNGKPALHPLGVPELTIGSIKDKKKGTERNAKDVKANIIRISRKLMIEADTDFEQLVDDHVRVVWKETMDLFEPKVKRLRPVSRKSV